jgi:S1-C subfamily serine protease
MWCVRLLLIMCFGLVTGTVSAQDVGAARRQWQRLDPEQRTRVVTSLMATGHYNGVLVLDLNRRVLDALVAFQREAGLIPNGVPDLYTIGRLQNSSAAILRRLGMATQSHPTTGARLLIPWGLGLTSLRTSTGIAFERSDRAASLDFSWRAEADQPFEAIWSRLSTQSPTRRITYRVNRGTFMVIAGEIGADRFYTRWERIPGGSVGFTWRFDPNRIPDGYRVSVLMSALFIARAAAPPTVASAPDSPVPPRAPAPQPASPVARVSTGSGFFVSRNGHVVTNAHVVAGCTAVHVQGRNGYVSARDTRNDLALVETSQATEPLPVRSTSVELGEAVYALGFPLAGVLDNGLNITQGLVSSLSGIGGDSSVVQFTAPVQPGNSGGPLVDQNGQVAGVVVGRLNDIEALRQSGSLPQNVNFAVRADVVRSFLQGNGIDAYIQTVAARTDTTDIARAGRRSVVQVRCERSPGS